MKKGTFLLSFIFLDRFNVHNLSKGLKCTVGTPFHNVGKESPFFCHSCMVGFEIGNEVSGKILKTRVAI